MYSGVEVASNTDCVRCSKIGGETVPGVRCAEAALARTNVDTTAPFIVLGINLDAANPADGGHKIGETPRKSAVRIAHNGT